MASNVRYDSATGRVVYAAATGRPACMPDWNNANDSLRANFCVPYAPEAVKVAFVGSIEHNSDTPLFSTTPGDKILPLVQSERVGVYVTSYIHKYYAEYVDGGRTFKITLRLAYDSNSATGYWELVLQTDYWVYDSYAALVWDKNMSISDYSVLGSYGLRVGSGYIVNNITSVSVSSSTSVDAVRTPYVYQPPPVWSVQGSPHEILMKARARDNEALAGILALHSANAGQFEIDSVASHGDLREWVVSFKPNLLLSSFNTSIVDRTNRLEAVSTPNGENLASFNPDHKVTRRYHSPMVYLGSAWGPLLPGWHNAVKSLYIHSRGMDYKCNFRPFYYNSSVGVIYLSVDNGDNYIRFKYERTLPNSLDALTGDYLLSATQYNASWPLLPYTDFVELIPPENVSVAWQYFK